MENVTPQSKVQLEEKELTEIKQLRADFSNLYMNLGVIQVNLVDLEKEKQNIIATLSELKASETTLFEALKTKYGEGVVNIDTGEFIEDKSK